MASLYYFAAYTNSGCLCGCDHEHATVISAVACTSVAGGYVVAVEDGQLRELNNSEEREFQLATYHGEVLVRGIIRLWRKLATNIPTVRIAGDLAVAVDGLVSERFNCAHVSTPDS